MNLRSFEGFLWPALRLALYLLAALVVTTLLSMLGDGIPGFQ